MYSKIVYEMYVDYRNNYLSLAKFAEHNLLSEEDAGKLLDIGRKIAYIGLHAYQQEQL